MTRRVFRHRDLRLDTDAVIQAANEEGAVTITKYGKPVATVIGVRDRKPYEDFLDIVLALPVRDSGWADELANDADTSLEPEPWE